MWLFLLLSSGYCYNCPVQYYLLPNLLNLFNFIFTYSLYIQLTASWAPLPQSFSSPFPSELVTPPWESKGLSLPGIFHPHLSPNLAHQVSQRLSSSSPTEDRQGQLEWGLSQSCCLLSTLSCWFISAHGPLREVLFSPGQFTLLKRGW